MSKIAVVTGGFQLLHRGHINILQEAKKLGEVWVLLNSDEALMKTKGYVAEYAVTRTRKLFKTELVSKVILIETDPTEALRSIKPDYQVCGSDYTVETVMSKGGEFVGEIVIIPYTKGVCSTDLYKKSQE